MKFEYEALSFSTGIIDAAFLKAEGEGRSPESLAATLEISLGHLRKLKNGTKMEEHLKIPTLRLLARYLGVTPINLFLHVGAVDFTDFD